MTIKDAANDPRIWAGLAGISIILTIVIGVTVLTYQSPWQVAPQFGSDPLLGVRTIFAFVGSIISAACVTIAVMKKGWFDEI